ncbi:MAG: hypothetical protein JWR07_1453, partial [Nevskia sp.]|nr:hypothetical protein [Nevskia sp.]
MKKMLNAVLLAAAVFSAPALLA